MMTSMEAQIPSVTKTLAKQLLVSGGQKTEGTLVEAQDIFHAKCIPVTP